MTTTFDPIAVALLVTRAFDALGIAHTVGGSIASSFAGEPRSTVDIDVVAALSAAGIPALVAALSADFYVDPDSLGRAVRDRSSAILGIVRVQGERLDRSYLAASARVIDVVDLLERALRDGN